jgi:MOSC domain-containing protein
MPSVVGLNITPVKSTSLHHPETIDLRVQGAVGDRRFLCMRRNGTRVSGISKAALMPIVAVHDRTTETLSLSFPDGATVEGDARAVGEVVPLALFDREISVRDIDSILTAALRNHLVDDTLTLARVEEPEYAGGTRRVSIVSRASVADVGARAASGTGLDPRRFRMLIEVDGVEPYEEDSWQGLRVAIGDAIVRVGERMPRCVMTTLDPDTGAQDVPVLQVLGAYRLVEGKPILGVSGDVEREASITVGDPVRLLPG